MNTTLIPPHTSSASYANRHTQLNKVIDRVKKEMGIIITYSVKHEADRMTCGKRQTSIQSSLTLYKVYSTRTVTSPYDFLSSIVYIILHRIMITVNHSIPVSWFP